MQSRKSVFTRSVLAGLILLVAVFVGPGFVLADDAKKEEGSSTTGQYSKFKHKSPHGKPMGHGKSEGSSMKKEGSGKGYGHKSGHGYKKHGYRGHGKGHHGHKQDPFAHVLRFAHSLGLSAEQVQKIRDKQFEFKKQRIQLRAEHEIANMELDRLVHSGNVDENALRAIGERLKQIKAHYIDGMINAKIALLQTLTDEQRKKIRQLHAHRSGGSGHGR